MRDAQSSRGTVICNHLKGVKDLDVDLGGGVKNGL